MRLRRSSPPAGLLRRFALGQEALYRVVDDTPEVVEVEVVSAPGLPSGTRVRFTAAAARAMERGARDPSVTKIRSEAVGETPAHEPSRRVASGPVVRG